MKDGALTLPQVFFPGAPACAGMAPLRLFFSFLPPPISLFCGPFADPRGPGSQSPHHTPLINANLQHSHRLTASRLVVISRPHRQECPNYGIIMCIRFYTIMNYIISDAFIINDLKILHCALSMITKQRKVSTL